MKRILAIALLTTSLAASAQAAAIVGFEAGYLTDAKEAYYSARFGYELKADTSLSHQLEVEIGYTEQSETQSVAEAVMTAKGKIMPLTLNYRAEFAGTDKLGFYFGIGVGMARTSISESGASIAAQVITISDHASSLAYQGFAGVTYKATDTTSLHLGVKYLKIDDIKVMGGKASVGDDFIITAGVSLKF